MRSWKRNWRTRENTERNLSLMFIKISIRLPSWELWTITITTMIAAPSITIIVIQHKLSSSYRFKPSRLFAAIMIMFTRFVFWPEFPANAWVSHVRRFHMSNPGFVWQKSHGWSCDMTHPPLPPSIGSHPFQTYTNISVFNCHFLSDWVQQTIRVHLSFFDIVMLY